MSGNDPFDPFGQNERTIIRPNPGGRPATPQPGGAAPQPAAQPAPGAPPPQGGAAAPAGAFGSAPVGQPVASVATPGSNPLIVAAGPMLDLLGRLRNAMTQATCTDLKASFSRAVNAFEKSASEAGAYPEQLKNAKYALCATADDIVQNLPDPGDLHVWTQHPLLSDFFNERIGGQRFYDNLDEALKNPGANYDLLELKYACMSLGFIGKYRAGPSGMSDLAKLRSQVYQALRGVTPGGGWALSPNWKGMDIGKKSVGMQIPFWAIAALAGILLMGLFFGLRVALASETEDLTQEVSVIHPTHDIEIARADFTAAPPPPPPAPVVVDDGQLDRIRAALASEISQGLVSADYLDANFIIVRMSNKLLFPSGKADVTGEFKTVLAPRIGEVFANETELLRTKGFKHGRVIALGHSDAQPLSSTSRFGSNHGLSKARAQSVIDAIAAASPADLRTLVEGRGPDDPICTPAEDRGCWPDNRRVELLIERTQ